MTFPRHTCGLFAWFLVIASPEGAWCQVDHPSPPVVRDNEEWIGPDDVFVVVEDMPLFPGGEDALFRFIGERMVYPPEAIDAGVQGTVYLTFVVEKDGSISGLQVMRGIGYGCDEEALRVLAEMPHWTPGRQRGANIRVRYTLPIRFKLE